MIQIQNFEKGEAPSYLSPLPYSLTREYIVGNKSLIRVYSLIREIMIEI